MLPRQVSVNTAAALLGRSPKAVRQLCDDGLLQFTGTPGLWRRIPLAAIEQRLGHAIDAATFMEATASLSHQREMWARASADRRASRTNAASGSMAS